MSIVGIVAEFNPFHNGHKYLIDCAKNDGHTVCCVISSNFVQRGDVAIISKFKRAKQALCCGADVVVELPTPWSMSTAQNFALGAVSQLNAMGVGILYFGSECGDTELLIKAAQILSSDEFSLKLKQKVNTNKTFAITRQEILANFSADLGSILDNPNDTLAIEYIIAARSINPNISFKAIKRVGVNHNDSFSSENYSSSTQIRNNILSNELERLTNFVPQNALDILLKSSKADINRLEKAIIVSLRKVSLEDLSKLPDISEGIENLIYDSIQKATSLNELYGYIKSKRYTLARIRRLVLSAFLNLNNSYSRKEPPYVRVIGFKKESASLLPRTSSKPIITRVCQIKKLDAFSKDVFRTECMATDLWAMALENPIACGNDFTEEIIKI